jgi:hypothetical protein
LKHGLGHVGFVILVWIVLVGLLGCYGQVSNGRYECLSNGRYVCLILTCYVCLELLES